MSDEDFISRWSRRKQEASAAQRTLPPGNEVASPSDAAATDAEPEIDLSKLPPLDSITAATDITEFLRKGIPAELSRAALRRAWAADPAIRDFVGLAENAWDFTDPNAMPGFGGLEATPEQVGAMVERVFSGARETVEKLTTDSSEGGQSHEKPDSDRPDLSSAEVRPANDSIEQPPVQRPQPLAAAQPEISDDRGDVMPARRRTHGGALPT